VVTTADLGSAETDPRAEGEEHRCRGESAPAAPSKRLATPFPEPFVL